MQELKSTTDYDRFLFRKDNRAAINKTHVQRLANSIKSRNLLELRPITVNSDMEVIDGQHRLLAAKQLGVPIYYVQEASLTPKDVIALNVAQNWRSMDYLNYYCQNDYHEYKKLAEFMRTNNLTIKVALNITMGQSHENHDKFRSGGYVFSMDVSDEGMDICWDTIAYIRKMNGYSNYTNSSKFWSSLLKLVRHTNFDPVKWRENLSKMVERVGPRISQQEYLKMLMDIHNWRNTNKVDLE